MADEESYADRGSHRYWTLDDFASAYQRAEAELDATRSALISAYVALGRVLMAEEAEYRWWSESAAHAREGLGLPPAETPPIGETMALLREQYGTYFEGVDADAFVAELRGDDDDDPGSLFTEVR